MKTTTILLLFCLSLTLFGCSGYDALYTNSVYDRTTPFSDPPTATSGWKSPMYNLGGGTSWGLEMRDGQEHSILVNFVTDRRDKIFGVQHVMHDGKAYFPITEIYLEEECDLVILLAGGGCIPKYREHFTIEIKTKLLQDAACKVNEWPQFRIYGEQGQIDFAITTNALQGFLFKIYSTTKRIDKPCIG